MRKFFSWCTKLFEWLAWYLKIYKEHAQVVINVFYFFTQGHLPGNKNRKNVPTLMGAVNIPYIILSSFLLLYFFSLAGITTPQSGFYKFQSFLQFQKISHI